MLRLDWLMDNLSDVAEVILLHVLSCPFSSASDVAAWRDLGAAHCYRNLQSLERHGLLASAALGRTRRKQQRWWTTFKGIQACQLLLGEPPISSERDQVPYENSRLGIKWWLRRFPVLEQVYHIVPHYRDPALQVFPYDSGGVETKWPAVEHFELLRGPNLHAIARIEGGILLAFVWVGLWWNHTTARNKWRDWDAELNHVSGEFDTLYEQPDPHMGDSGVPSAWVLVCSDPWAAQVAHSEYTDYPGAPKEVWTPDGLLKDAGLLLPSRATMSKLKPTTAVGKVDGFGAFIEEDAIHNALNGQLRYRTFTTVESFRGLRRSKLTAMVGDSSKNVKPGVEAMIEAGIFADLDDRLWVDGLGRSVGAWRDRVSPNLAHGRLAFLTSEDPKHVEQRRRLLKHEGGVNELALAFKAAGIPCFVGWRETVTLPVPTELQEMFGWPKYVQIAPDLIVRAGGGTFGNAWYFVEFERTASSRNAVIH